MSADPVSYIWFAIPLGGNDLTPSGVGRINACRRLFWSKNAMNSTLCSGVTRLRAIPKQRSLSINSKPRGTVPPALNGQDSFIVTSEDVWISQIRHLFEQLNWLLAVLSGSTKSC
jgi:hypothetical protein